MTRATGKLAAGVLAMAALLAAGCLPRGPFPPAILFGEGAGPDCPDSAACPRCRRGDRSANEAAGYPGGQLPIVAPISDFQPVPTRPVFTPWVVNNPAPEEISGELAWKRAVTPPPSERIADLSPLIEQRSPGPVARRVLPPPARMPDERPVAPDVSLPAPTPAAPADQSTNGWHASASQF